MPNNYHQTDAPAIPKSHHLLNLWRSCIACILCCCQVVFLFSTKLNFQNSKHFLILLLRWCAVKFSFLPSFVLSVWFSPRFTNFRTFISLVHRRRLHRGNRELRPGTHARTGANVAFCPGTFHGCALIF